MSPYSWLLVRITFSITRPYLPNFLVDESSYVNGQNWRVDGGLTSTLPTIPGRWA